MALYRHWVFEATCTDARFRRLLEQLLRERGYSVDPAKVYDVAIRGEGARAYLAIGYHERGIEVNVKVKGLMGRPARLSRALLEAGRAAQARLAFEREA